MGDIPRGKLIKIMSKYELMLVVDGELTETEARAKIESLTSLFNSKNSTNFTEKLTLNDKLAYPINKKTVGHRFLFNFETSDTAAIHEFNRLVIINKAVLRHLLMNVEKNYAYKTLVNPKKIKVSEFRQNKYLQYLANKEKKLQQLEAEAALGASVVEAKMRRVRDYKNVDTTASKPIASTEETSSAE